MQASLAKTNEELQALREHSHSQLAWVVEEVKTLKEQEQETSTMTNANGVKLGHQ